MVMSSLSDILREDVAIMDKSERRKITFAGKIQREIWSWFIDTDIDTMEKMFMSVQFALMTALAFWADRLIAQPPPIIQNHIPTPNGIFWVSMLACGLVLQVRGRIVDKSCDRRNGCVFSFFICLGIIGPAFLKTPLFGSILLTMVIWQGILAARLIRMCQKTSA